MNAYHRSFPTLLLILAVLFIGCDADEISEAMMETDPYEVRLDGSGENITVDIFYGAGMLVRVDGEELESNRRYYESGVVLPFSHKFDASSFNGATFDVTADNADLTLQVLKDNSVIYEESDSGESVTIEARSWEF